MWARLAGKPRSSADNNENERKENELRKCAGHAHSVEWRKKKVKKEMKLLQFPLARDKVGQWRLRIVQHSDIHIPYI